MSNVITHRQLMEWLDEQEALLKDKIMGEVDPDDRTSTYNLYHATQLLRANIMSGLAIPVEWEHNRYDEPQPNEENN